MVGHDGSKLAAAINVNLIGRIKTSKFFRVWRSWNATHVSNKPLLIAKMKCKKVAEMFEYYAGC